jgi:hypothetical protein
MADRDTSACLPQTILPPTMVMTTLASWILSQFGSRYITSSYQKHHGIVYNLPNTMSGMAHRRMAREGPFGAKARSSLSHFWQAFK